MNNDTEPALAASSNDLKLPKKQQYILSHFLINLEIFLCLQLAAIYYVNPQFVVVFLHAAILANFIPIQSPTTHKIHVVLLVNAVTLLFHLLGESPKPVTEHAQYLSGGLLLDLVGEFPHTSRLKLMMLDLIVFATEILMMATGNERLKTQSGLPAAPDADLEAAEEGRAVPSQVEGNNTELVDNRPPILDDVLGSEDSVDATSTIVISLDENLRDIANNRVYTHITSRNQAALGALLTAAIRARTGRAA